MQNDKKYSIANLIYERVGSDGLSFKIPNKNPLPLPDTTIRSLSIEEGPSVLGYYHSAMLSSQFSHFMKDATDEAFEFNVSNADEFLKIFSIAGIGYNLLFFMDGTSVSISRLFKRRAKNFKRIELALNESFREKTSWHMALVAEEEEIPDTEKKIQEKYLYFLEKHIDTIKNDLYLIKREIATLSNQKVETN